MPPVRPHTPEPPVQIDLTQFTLTSQLDVHLQGRLQDFMVGGAKGLHYIYDVYYMQMG